MRKMALSMALLTSALLADGQFVGFSVGKYQGDYKNGSVSVKPSSQTDVAFRGGLYKDTYRAYIDVEPFMNESTTTKEGIRYKNNHMMGVVSVDGLNENVAQIGSYNVGLFAGFHAGIINWKSKQEGAVSKNDSGNAVAGGLQGGMMVGLNEAMSAEVGYRYSWLDMEVNDMKLENMDKVSVGLNFKF